MRTFMLLLLAWALSGGPSAAAQAVPEPPAFDHSSWDSLLQEFVDEVHRVDYARLLQQGRAELDSYLSKVAATDPDSLSPASRKALLINAYNALTVGWVLEHYPVPSIWSTPDPFKASRHTLGGKKLSLDEIESLLRTTGDPRIHAAVVCAARSCPPLRREAYTAEQIDVQLDDNTRQWLANPALNRFEPETGRAEVSPIFKWYRDDFASYPGQLEGFLKHFAPEDAAPALAGKNLQIMFNDYDWGLNDQSAVGEGYSFFQLGIDWIKNLFR